MNQAAEPLTDEEDAFGRLLLDYLAGNADEPFLERDDGHTGPALPAEWYFAERAQWPEAEQASFGFVQGRVLDIGAGAARHSSRHRGKAWTSWRSTSRRAPSKCVADVV